MAYAYGNLVAPQNTGSGIADYMLMAPVTDFAADGIKCPAAPFTNPGDEITINDDHVFLTGKKFSKILFAPEKNQLDAKTVGDKGFQKFDIEVKGFIPGSYAVLHEAAKNWMNKPHIFLVKDSNCPANMYYQLGCDCVYAYITVDFSTGTTKDGVKGYAATITYQNPYVQLYAGTVEVY